MNEQNLDYLSRQIKFTGFGEGHAAELKENMNKGVSEFSLSHVQEFGKDQVRAQLNFRKSEQSDLYFFNNYALSLSGPQKNESLKQTFYINPKEDNITLKEGYNLLNGRAIQKEHTPREGEKYNAWLQLDFKESDKHGQYKIKQYHPNYGYDLESTLHKHPIQELATNEGIKRLLESLERGNRQQVIYGQGDDAKKVFIEASPQFKSINMYDESMKKIMINSLKPSQIPRESLKQASDESVTVSRISKTKGGKEMSPDKSDTEEKTKPKKQKLKL
jgi:hypothetical protein